jgi:hypothetical protein
MFFLEAHQWAIEVEVIGVSRTGHEVKIDDVKAVRPQNTSSHGYLALLDLLPPVQWYMLSYQWLGSVDPSHFTRLHLEACREAGISADCTNACEKLLLANTIEELCPPYHQAKMKLQSGINPWRLEL